MLLDVNTEAHLYKLYCKYEELLLGKTSIFISHRLSSCKLSDKIVLLENGSIIEEGNHDELMAKQGGYYNMFKLQANQYKIGANGNA
jgi:ATP-binding cassette subfamily B protein